MLKKNLQVLAVLLFSGHAYADAYQAPTEVMVPVAFQAEEHESANDVLSCKEARETAWFQHELSRTDGGSTPDVQYAECKPDILARSTADAD